MKGKIALVYTFTFLAGFATQGNRTRIAPSEHRTAQRAAPERNDGVVLDTHTARRWLVFDKVESLKRADSRDEIPNWLKRQLNESSSETFESIALLPEGHPGEENLIRHLVRHLLGSSPVEASRLLAILRHKDIYDLIATNLSGMIASDPSRQHELFEWWALYPDDARLAENTSPALADILHRDSTPESILNAFEKTMSLPSGITQGRLLTKIIQATLPNQLGLAEDMLSHLARHPEYDAAISEFAFATSERYPEIAMRWAQAIHEDELRIDTIDTIADRWIHNDPSGFDEFLAPISLQNRPNAPGFRKP